MAFLDFPSLADAVAVKPSGLYRDIDRSSRGWAGISVGAGWLADLVRVRINYVLEIHVGGRLDRAIALPMAPSEIRISRPSGTDLKYTLGRVPIRDHTSYRALTIEVRGRSGLSRRSGNDRNGNIVFEQGPTLLREFDAFLDYYQDLAARKNTDYLRTPDTFRTRGAERVSLVFRAFDEALHVEVEPDNWERSRNAQRSRFSEEWALNLKAYGPVAPEVPGNFLGPVADAAVWLSGAINQFNNALAAGNNLLKNARADLEVLREPFRRLQETGRIVAEIRDSARDLAAFPRTLLADMGLSSAEMRAALEEKKGTEDALGRGFGAGKLEVRRLLNDVAEAEMFAWTALGLLGGGPRTRGIAFRRREQLFSGRSIPPTLPYRTDDEQRGQIGDLAYALRAGDTLRSLALVVYGDASRWTEIAERNGMQSSRQEADGSPLDRGDLIILPKAGGSALVPSPQLRPEEMFGRDLLLTGGDLRVNVDGTDVDTIVGPPLFEQAIRNRVLARQGESAAFPAYGLPMLPGDKLTAGSLGYLAAHTVEQLSRDPRTREVPAVGAVDSGDALALAVQVIPVIGEALTTISSFPSG